MGTTWNEIVTKLVSPTGPDCLLVKVTKAGSVLFLLKSSPLQLLSLHMTISHTHMPHVIVENLFVCLAIQKVSANFSEWFPGDTGERIQRGGCVQEWGGKGRGRMGSAFSTVYKITRFCQRPPKAKEWASCDGRPAHTSPSLPSFWTPFCMFITHTYLEIIFYFQMVKGV